MLKFTRTLLIGSVLFSCTAAAEIDVQPFTQELPQGAGLGFIAKNIQKNYEIKQIKIGINNKT